MNNYSSIDLDKVKSDVAHYAAIQDAKDYILNEEVSFNPIEIKHNLIKTKEFLSLLNANISISFDGIHNINEILIKASKNVILTSLELSEVLNFSNHLKRIKDIFKEIDNELEIRDYIDSIYISDVLNKEISKSIDNYGNVKDDASPTLKKIIYDISDSEKSLYDEANKFMRMHQNSLQEQATYLRNNRLTILVKNSEKNKFKGYSYGSSSSGLARYIEPEDFVNLNNKYLELLENKDIEINNILRNLTYIVSENAENYINNFDSIIKLNSVYAKAMYGYKRNGILANISNFLEIKDVAHPLIDEETVVLNTYSLNKPYKGIVISGTNTGGKTVGLKCIGLSTLMTYLGIPLIATSANIPIYDNVFVDIDDNQSISNSLSTFSAHIINIDNILTHASSNSLILIDELISGTDPKEAQAISLSILNKIEQIGSSFVITTHYDDIKNYAYNNELILLSSVGFDSEKLKPTYKYIENSVGSSNALEIADRYFKDKSIVNFATNIIKTSISKQDELLDKLSKEIEENENLKTKSNKLIDEYKSKINELNSKLSSFDKEKADLKKKYNDELNTYIESIKEKANEVLEDIKNKQSINSIDKLDSFKVATNEVKEELCIEDLVRIGDTSRQGTIVDIKGNYVTVNVNGMSIKTTSDNLTKLEKRKIKEYTPKQRTFKQIKHELVIVGKHIDEAMDEIEVFLDNALANNLTQVRIVHGYGTGQLKSATREKLKKLKFVKSFKDADFNEGGSAITIVKLK